MADSITEEEIREIVIARLRTVPDKFKLVIGNRGSFTKEQLIDAVEEESDVGNKFVDIQMHYLKSLKNLG